MYFLCTYSCTQCRSHICPYGFAVIIYITETKLFFVYSLFFCLCGSILVYTVLYYLFSLFCTNIKPYILQNNFLYLSIYICIYLFYLYVYISLYYICVFYYLVFKLAVSPLDATTEYILYIMLCFVRMYMKPYFFVIYLFISYTIYYFFLVARKPSTLHFP